jgi:hypothetical protein
MLSNAEYQVNQTRTVLGSMMNQFVGTLDLTGAEIEYAGQRMNVTTGKLGHFDANTREVRGRLSVVSSIRPNVWSSDIRIRWQNHEFEVMMMSVQDMSDNGELKLKFIARWIPPVLA